MPDYDNRGSIWKNDRKKTDKHPDFTGNAMIAGVEYWVDAWKRGADAKEKAPALRFTFKPKEEKRQAAPADDFEDDIPF